MLKVISLSVHCKSALASTVIDLSVSEISHENFWKMRKKTVLEQVRKRILTFDDLFHSACSNLHQSPTVYLVSRLFSFRRLAHLI